MNTLRTGRGFRLNFERLIERRLFAGLEDGGGTTVAPPQDSTPAPPAIVAPPTTGGIDYADPYGIGHCNPNYGSGYYVTIYVDQPGTGGDADIYEGIGDVGHTWIEVGYEGGTSVSGGLYPDGQRTDSENHHGYDVSVTFPISEQQYHDIIDRLNDDHANPPTYELDGYNCTDYALDVLHDHTDYVIETQEVQYPYQMGNGTSPGTLGQDIVNNYDGTYSPNSTSGGQP